MPAIPSAITDDMAGFAQFSTQRTINCVSENHENWLRAYHYRSGHFGSCLFAVASGLIRSNLVVRSAMYQHITDHVPIRTQGCTMEIRSRTFVLLPITQPRFFSTACYQHGCPLLKNTPVRRNNHHLPRNHFPAVLQRSAHRMLNPTAAGHFHAHDGYALHIVLL